MAERRTLSGATSPVKVIVLALAVLVAVGVIAMIRHIATKPPIEVRAPGLPTRGEPVTPDPTFVGSDACADCHDQAAAAWQGSQHQRAMQPATAATVLGDFSEARYTYAGVESRFFSRDGRYFVRTDGAAGELADFEIRYTFGVYPLQQYLVEFPDGRLQALSIAWDDRPREQGGQRWFHLYPDERITHDDELHWTGREQNWNFMCADCHSTDVRKNYDVEADAFATQWAEISVGCEACHGPGSAHVAWARAGRDAGDPGTMGLTVRLDARSGARWQIDPANGTAVRGNPKPHDREMDVCAQCHSRRSQIAEEYRAGEPFLDHYLPAMIDPPLFWVDGQQRDEVYVWASFLESRMYAQGVTCSDCHEPHSQALRAPGNAVCTQCHLAAKYDGPQHHFHESGTAGAGCANCHMPEDTYMVIDPRRDHSLRVPRPDESIAYGVPNACNDCHVDQTARWAVEALQAWYGHSPRGFQQFTGALASAEQGRARAAENLVALIRDRSQPAIVRATAASGLVNHPQPVIQPALVRSLNDPDPLVRRGALTGLELFAPEARLEYAGPLLDDPLRVVRVQAAYALAGVPLTAMTAAQRAAFERAADEFIAVQQYNADRPEALMLSAGFEARRGNATAAEQTYRRALERFPDHLPAYVNLADLYRVSERETEAVSVLRAGLERHPDNASLHHALGLALVRLQQPDQALPELARAAQLAPWDGRFAYVYAVALRSRGKLDEALAVLERALERGPEDRDLLIAAILFSRDAGRPPDALRWARQLASAYPEDPDARQLLAEIEAAVR